MFQIFAALLLVLVPVCCSARDNLEGLHMDTLRSTLPFCRLVEWEEEGSFFREPYGNWAKSSFDCTYESYRNNYIWGWLGMTSFKKPFPDSFGFSTLEEGIEAFLESNDFFYFQRIEDGPDLTCTILHQDSNSVILSYVMRWDSMTGVNVAKLSFSGDWLHVVEVLYIGLDQDKLIDFEFDELPQIQEWLKKLKL